MLSNIPVSFLFRLEAFVDQPIAISPGPQADRVIVAPTGGVVEGPAFNGEIVAGPSSEWATLRADNNESGRKAIAKSRSTIRFCDL